MIRPAIQAYSKTIPTILEIPSKDQPYDPEKDTVMQRVLSCIGETL
jgi:V-type H+-transporting ATPase subunit F